MKINQFFKTQETFMTHSFMKRRKLIFRFFTALLTCCLLVGCGLTEEQKADAIIIFKENYPNYERKTQELLQNNESFKKIAGGKWKLTVEGTKSEPFVRYGYYGHKTWLQFGKELIIDIIIDIPLAFVGSVIYPTWDSGISYTWDIDIAKRSATPSNHPMH